MPHAQTPDNMLIVMADQLTAMALSCHGGAAKTPHIDALAARGVVFEAAYSSSPLCAPARYAFMSGQHISRCGGYDNAAYLPATTPTFAHYLRLAGYRTCLAGKMHFVGADQLHGFEERATTDIYPADFGWVPDWHKPDERIDLWYHNMSSVKQAGVAAITNQLAYDDEVGAQSLRAIYDHARDADARPLCLVVGFIHPHDPYAARREFWDLYRHDEIPPPRVGRLSPQRQDAHSKRLEKAIALDAASLSPAEIIHARRAYFANVSYIDHWLGKLLHALDDCGLADSTTVIFTSDHGDMLGERGLWYKMSFMEWSCRIPLIVARPGGDGGGGDDSADSADSAVPRRVSQPVSQVDILPTLVALARQHMGQDAPPFEAIDALDGRNLLPLCGGGGDSHRRGGGDGDGYGEDSAISEYLAEGTSAPMLMIRRGRYKYIACETDPELLFDLAVDADELCNLAVDGDAARAGVDSAVDSAVSAAKTPQSAETAAITKTAAAKTAATTETAAVLAAFRQQAAAHWDAAHIKRQVMASQNRRRRVHAALAIGRRHSWDFTPPRNAAQEYTRSHLDLTHFDSASRYPRPRRFKMT